MYVVSLFIMHVLRNQPFPFSQQQMGPPSESGSAQGLLLLAAWEIPPALSPQASVTGLSPTAL